MATSNILGLFVSPEQYQAQQLAQQQADEQTRATNFANLDARGQAVYGTFLGAQQLGRGFGGLLGVQDPQLQRIRQRQEIMQTINPADPGSLMAGVQRASQAGDQELALSLADYMRKAEGDIALAKQRGAEKLGQGIQEAARINEIEMQLPNLDPDSAEYKALTAEKQRLQRTVKAASGDKLAQLTDLYAQRKEKVGFFGEDSQDVKIIDRLINSIAPEKGGDKTFERLVIAERIGVLTDEIDELEKNNQKNTPAYNRKVAELKSLQGDKAGAPIKELVLGEEIAKLDAFIRGAKDPAAPDVIDAKTKVQLYRDAMKRDKPNLSVVGEIRSGPDKGKTVYVDESKDQQFIYSADSSGKQVRKLVSDADVSRLTSQVTATATSTAKLPPGTDEVVRGLGKLDVDDMKTIRDNMRTARASNASLKKLSELNDAGLISGAFASGRVGVSNFLNTIGVLSGADKSRLATSQQYEKVGADLVFQSLQGKLGPGVSEGDRLFIERLFPRLETDPAARRELINYLAAKNNALINEGNRAEKWLRDNKSFEGYTPSVEGLFYAPSAGTARTMTDAELDAAIKAKKGK
jgi:hypothetical protein